MELSYCIRLSGSNCIVFTILPKETAPYDDRSLVIASITAPEGATYEYTDRFMQELGQMINDSIPEKKLRLSLQHLDF